VPDSAAVDAALVAKLSSDATLTALMTDGVYFDIAPHGKTKFVIVSLLAEEDEPMFTGRAYEEGLYLVKAVSSESSAVNARSAAARIDALLENGTLTVTGYSLMRLTRVNRVRYMEVDEADTTIRWQHQGGHYSVAVCA